MKKFFFIAMGFYTLIFLSGYIGIHIKGKEKSKDFCERLMAEEVNHLWIVPLLAPGEGNACMDLGFLPVKK